MENPKLENTCQSEKGIQIKMEVGAGKKVFSQFLDVSTIHGLGYLNLTDGKRKVKLVFWIVCIGFSFTAAGVFIQKNLRDWMDSPTALSAASSVLISENEIEQPMITVCPRTPDILSLIVNYFNSDLYKQDKKFDEDFNRMVEELMPLVTHFRTSTLAELYGDKYDTTWKFFGKCDHVLTENIIADNSTFNASEECKFFMLLSNIGCNIRIEKTINKFIYNYAKKAIENRETIDWKHLRDTFNRDYMNGGKIEETKCWMSSRSAWYALQAYAYFFPVFKPSLKRGNLTIEDMLPMKNLSDFDPAQFANMFDLTNVTDKGTLFGFVNSFSAITISSRRSSRYETTGHKSVTAFLIDKIVNDTAAILNLPPNSTVVLQYITQYGYDAINYPFYKLETATSGYDACNQNGTGVVNPCESSVKSEACSAYCKSTELTREQEQHLTKLLEMSTFKVNGGQSEVYRNSLPLCDAPTPEIESFTNIQDNCWKKVLTDKGVCFANLKTPGQLIFGAEDASGFAFLLDVQKDFDDLYYLNNYKTKHPFRVQFLLSPRNHFSVGKIYTEAEQVREQEYQTQEMTWLGLIYKVSNLVKATQEYKDLSSSSRGCLYKDEKQLEFFPIYAQSNCFLECAWKHAATECGCVPWFLKEHFNDSKICELFGNNCFKGIVSNKYDMKGPCFDACKPDCEAVEMTIHNIVVSKRRNVIDQCFEQVSVLDKAQWTKDLPCVKNYRAQKLIDTNRTHPYMSLVMDKFGFEIPILLLDNLQILSIPDSRTSPEMDMAQQNPNMVRVYTLTPTGFRIDITSSTTFVEMVSNVGGILGLFAGFSLLSGAEIIFWFVDYFSAKCHCGNKKCGTKH